MSVPRTIQARRSDPGRGERRAGARGARSRDWIRDAHARAGHAGPADRAAVLHDTRRPDGAPCRPSAPWSASRRSCAGSSDSACGCGACPTCSSCSTSRSRIRPGSKRSCARSTPPRLQRHPMTQNPARPTRTMTEAPEIAAIRDAIGSRQRFLISSHARPDGDSIGSQLAMAFALRALGKHVEIVNKDAAPPPLMAFPGVASITIADRATGAFDAALIMECSDLSRTGVEGLDQVLSDQHRSPSRQRLLRRDQLVRRRRCGLRRDGVRHCQSAGRSALGRDCHAYLHRDPDRHRVVPLFEHHAANVRHLPAARRGRRRAAARGAKHLRQQHARTAEAVRCRAEHD